jgi:hypothetical protein
MDTTHVEGEDNIKMDLKRCGSVEWIQLAQGMVQWLAVVDTVTNLGAS